MKQIFFAVFCLALGGLSLACNSNRENIIAESSEQNAPSQTQSIVEAEQPVQPTPLSEKHLKRREEVHKLMLKGEYLHDGSMELEGIGDISSVPALLVVLKENPPSQNGGMICTTAHALKALQKITGANPGITYKDWSAWWKKYQQEQMSKEK